MSKERNLTATQLAVNSNELFSGVSEGNAERSKSRRFSFEGARLLAERKGFELFRNRGRTDGKTLLGAYHYAKSKLPPFGLSSTQM